MRLRDAMSGGGGRVFLVRVLFFKMRFGERKEIVAFVFGFGEM